MKIYEEEQTSNETLKISPKIFSWSYRNRSEMSQEAKIKENLHEDEEQSKFREAERRERDQMRIF